MSDVVFEARDVTYRYRDASNAAVSRISIDFAKGTLVAILGPNGAGKSTLLRLMLGALRPQSGSVHYCGRSVSDWPRAELACRIGVVTQSEELAFPMTVRELVAMGRYPHLGPWRRARGEDHAAIDRALERCSVHDLADRPVLELSGGERQRVRLARALAQEPATLAFDEPTAALDIAHEMALFELLAELRGDGVTTVIVTHNINVAARYADSLVMLDRGTVAAAGPPAAVLTRDTVESVYDWPVDIGTADGAPQVVPLKAGSTTEPRSRSSR